MSNLSIPLLHSKLIPFASDVSLEFFHGMCHAHICTRVAAGLEVIDLEQRGVSNAAQVVRIPDVLFPWRLDSLFEYHELLIEEFRIRYPQWLDLSPMKENPSATHPGFLTVRTRERQNSEDTFAIPEAQAQFLASINQMLGLGLFNGGRVEASVDSLLEAMDIPDENQKVAARLLLEKEFQSGRSAFN